MHDLFLRSLGVDVCSQMLKPEMGLVPAVTTLTVDGFDIRLEIQ